MTEFKLDKNYLLQITNELYRLTLLFPKKEPLRYKMREVGNDILANFVGLSEENDIQRKLKLAEESSKKIEILEGFLDIARAQNWVKVSDLISLRQEYNEIKDDLSNIDLVEKKDVQETAHVPVLESQEEEIIEETSLSDRQEKILKILREKRKAQVHEMKSFFPDISKRTLRRDLKELMENALIDRKGERSKTFYKIKRA